MKKITLILLSILTISCHSQQKNEMKHGKVEFYPKDLVYLKSIPTDVLNVTFKKSIGSSKTMLSKVLLRQVLSHENTRILNPNNELDAKLLAGYSYSPWYTIDFTTAKGNHKIELFLGGLGFMTLPNGNKGAIMIDLSYLKEDEDEKLLKYYKKTIKALYALSEDKNDVKEINQHINHKDIAYNIDKKSIQINNVLPHPSKEFNENIGISQYTIKKGYYKVTFWQGDTQILETDKFYPKMVSDFIIAAEGLTTQQGTYDVTMKLMKGNVLVFPDGLKIDLAFFSHKRTFKNQRSPAIAHLELSDKHSEEKWTIRRNENKNERGKFITSYESAEWKEYNIELTALSYDNYINIIVTKNRKPEIDNIKKLGKDSIIQLALDINPIDATNFEFISISANHKDVFVNFKNSTQYIPLNKKIVKDLTISILGRTTSYYPNANPDDFLSKEREYYNSNDKENKKVITFVFDAINKTKNIGNTCSEDFEMANVIIKEKETYYDVSVDTGSVMSGKRSKYKVKKETGEVYDVTHRHPSKQPLPLKEGEEETHYLTYFFKKQINAKSCVNTKVIKRTFVELKNIILKNSEPVIDNELDKTTATYISNNIRFIYVKDKNSYIETISIFDTKLAITYSLFYYNRETTHEYSIGSKYSIYLETKMFDEKKYKGIVAHFCKNIIDKDFTKSGKVFYPEEDLVVNPCPTQKELKKGFEILKKVILKNGKEDTDVDDNKYPNILYSLNDIDFSYRNISKKNNPMETITVSGNAESGFYWIIKSDDTYNINIKDYPSKISKQKHKAALAHFCTNLLNFKE